MRLSNKPTMLEPCPGSAIPAQSDWSKKEHGGLIHAGKWLIGHLMHLFLLHTVLEKSLISNSK